MLTKSSISCTFLSHYSDKYTNITFHVRSGDDNAARKHAKLYVSDARRWSHHAFYSGLSDSRSDEEKTELVEELWGKYEDMVAEAPAEHASRTVYAYLRVRKI